MIYSTNARDRTCVSALCKCQLESQSFKINDGQTVRHSCEYFRNCLKKFELLSWEYQGFRVGNGFMKTQKSKILCGTVPLRFPMNIVEASVGR
jgi:hypothetical protein